VISCVKEWGEKALSHPDISPKKKRFLEKEKPPV
jgi:hypothetical protein